MNCEKTLTKAMVILTMDWGVLTLIASTTAHERAMISRECIVNKTNVSTLVHVGERTRM